MPDVQATLIPELTWTGERFARDICLRVAPDGRIESVAARSAEDRGVELPGRALLPGFVNAHSHAFQRALRCEAQRFDTGSGNFWTWRETMYRLAEALDVDSFYEASGQCFTEMLRAGFTSVGEFHYLHHAADTYDDWAFDDAVLAAARDAGIRIVLIQTYYATGNVGQPLVGAQRRFAHVSRDAFLKQLDRLGAKLDPATQSLGIACHSIRAVNLDDLAYVRDFSLANRMPFHIHVEEARKEIDDCRRAYGKGPLAVLLEKLRIDDGVTSIHCTHSTPDDLREYAARGGRVCLCPITEGNLSDGFPDVPTIRAAGGKLCVGTDSNIRVSAAEELRWMEFAQRLRREQRGVVVNEAGHCAAALLEIGTTNGAEAIGVNTGAIEPGRIADLVTIDLDHPSMRGAADEAILDALLFGCGNGAIDRVWVGGREVSRSRRDPAQ